MINIIPTQNVGIEKPKIEDWNDLSLGDYVNRCEQDVRITQALWSNILKRFMFLYKDKLKLDKFFRYLEFKMDCANEAEQQGWKLDVELTKSSIEKLTKLQEEKIAELTAKAGHYGMNIVGTFSDKISGLKEFLFSF